MLCSQTRIETKNMDNMKQINGISYALTYSKNVRPDREKKLRYQKQKISVGIPVAGTVHTCSQGG